MDERLEEIKRYYSSAESLHPDIQEDIQWLTQQAEKAQELESDIKVNKKSVDWLLYQNKRYKQALEFYADEENYDRPYDNEDYFDYLPSEMDFDKGEKARQTLRGETE